MPLASGALLGPYEILGPIGAGGMGEVYKARDTRLERTVAVKVSKQAFEERFRNEALAIAKLNHPHIAALYDVGPDYLVMEHVEGKPLRGPLPLDEALRLAGQIADALEHAHERGIVHRDLKPSNVLVTKAGVKLLDFGLAKRVEERPTGDESHSTLTEAGSVSGTPRYMAPEQIDGKAADARTDVFAFGLVLYEVVTGRHAFEGKSGARVMAAILEKEPTPLSAVKPGISTALERVIATCLAKDPRERWQSMRELKHALAWAAGSELRPPARSHRSRLIAASLALAALVAAAAGLIYWQIRPRPQPAPVRLRITLPANALGIGEFSVSPDGRRVAFGLAVPDGPPQIYIRSLDALDAAPMPGGRLGSGPFWSPDSREIGFWGSVTGLQKIDVSSGTVRAVCQDCRASGGWVGYGATWGSRGVIVFSDLGRLFRVPAAGGQAESLGALVSGENGRFWPQFLPDGRHYLYLSLGNRPEDQGVYVGALDSDLRRKLVTTGYAAAYAGTGHLLYVKQDSLVAQPFDADRLQLSGDAVPALDEPVARGAGLVAGGAASFSTSTTGVLAWRPELREQQQLTWFDRAGRRLGTIGEPATMFLMDLSPDEKAVAVCRGAYGTARDIWLLDVTTGADRRLTFDAHDDCGATFSPDGKRIAFFSERRGVRELYVKAADGSGDDELLVASDGGGLSPEDWSADGRFVSGNVARPGQSQDLFLVPVSVRGEARLVSFLATPAMERESTLAPNGRYMAYQSNEAAVPSEKGIMNVFVREILASGEPGPGKWQVSQSRGILPRWRPDGRELFFFDPPALMAVDVQIDGAAFGAGAPKPLGVRLVGSRYFVTRDGQRFLFGVPVKPIESIRVLVNWRPSAAGS
jgi:eukaryotic-like serine/threonine-protein kinase